MENRLVIGEIIELEGQCFIRRDYQSDYVPIGVNHQVYEGDLIKPEANAIAVIQFINSEIVWRVPSGVESGVINGYAMSPEIIESSSGQLFSPR